MAQPIEISKAEVKAFPGTRWNAMIHICSNFGIRDLTPVQRVAHLAFGYMSEVYNGGHYQYFVNQRDLNHQEVIIALGKVDAHEQASILSDALNIIGLMPLNMPYSVEEYLASEQSAGLSVLDTRFYGCERTIETCLQDYLDKYEGEFIQWAD